ncbi:MAG TPA: phage portal protein, partial [Candidatus Eisenbacteria bacterium]|nr:phage portal protein [Candidatus Eisenbacteria bacterium]
KKASFWHPTHPNTALPPFIQMLERRIASGLRLSYITLGNDVSEGSFANSRIAIGAERRRWKRDQRWLIRDLKARIARRWFINVVRKRLFSPELLLAYPRDQVPFSWRQPTWEYGVNPLQDAQADVLRIQHRLTSHEAVIEERGGVLETVLEQEARAEALAVELELDLAPLAGPAAPQGEEAEEQTENGNGNGKPKGEASVKNARKPRTRSRIAHLTS